MSTVFHPMAGLFLALASTARAGATTALPQVTVPLPPHEDEPATSSAAKRAPSGAASTIAPTRTGELKSSAELVGQAPGALVQDLGGVGQTKSLSLRGASPNGVRVLLDGIPLNGPGGNVDLSQVPLAIVDHFEVLRGAVGASYGGGALGGALVVVTRRPKAAAEAFANVSYGSFGTASLEAGALGPVAGGEALAVAHFQRTRGDFPYLFDAQPALPGNSLTLAIREGNQAALGGALLKYRRALPRRWRLEAMGEFALLSRGLAGPIEQPTPSGRQQSQRALAAASASRALESNGSLELSAYARREHTTFQGIPFADGISQVASVVGARATLERLVGRHALTAAAEGAYEWLAESTQSNPSRPVVSASAMDELLFAGGYVIVAPAVRAEVVGPFLSFSPQLGTSWQLPFGLSLKANAGQAHRAPSFLELYVRQGTLFPNEQLKPERALFADATVEHRSARGALSATAFAALYENLIAYEFTSGLGARPHNFAAARAMGVEMATEFVLHRLAKLSASYTLQWTANLRDDPRYYLKELPFRPRHKAYARVSGGPSWGTVRAELLFQSAQFQNRTATEELPARAFVNVGVDGKLLRSPNVSAALELKNLLDVSAQDVDGYPLPSRGAYLTLSFAVPTEP